MGFLIRTLGRLVLLFFIADSLSIPAYTADEKVQWLDVDQLCGQLQLETPEKKTIIVDGKTESRLYTAYLGDATITLYPATSAENECCATSPIATVRSRKYGAFEFKGVQPGYYWLRVQKNGIPRLIPVHLRGSFSEKSCSDSSVRRSFVVDSTQPKIETRIR
ncbi:MAG TPA: hypothetical protein VEI01_18650 [Terriglobales bacterium]|nr:hypothetical protein [Terriglobales bacterium]